MFEFFSFPLSKIPLRVFKDLYLIPLVFLVLLVVFQYPGLTVYIYISYVFHFAKGVSTLSLSFFSRQRLELSFRIPV